MENFDKAEHYTRAISIHGVEIEARMWTNEDQPHINSVISIETGHARMQVSVSPADLRQLAQNFSDMARMIELFAAQISATHN